MAKQARDLPLPALTLDPGSPTPLHRQIYFEIRGAILDGRLRPGTRLPASRALARDLSISRNTVTTAFDQLVAEGYIEARTGAGSFVPDDLPEEQFAKTTASAQQPTDPRGTGTFAVAACLSSDGDGRQTHSARALLTGLAGGRSLSLQGVGAPSRPALATPGAARPDRRCAGRRSQALCRRRRLSRDRTRRLFADRSR